MFVMPGYGRACDPGDADSIAEAIAWFLDHPEEVRRTIPYIEQNPKKIGLAQQCWPFVKVYDDWPLHAGHSPNSPYARRLRALGRYPQ